MADSVSISVLGAVTIEVDGRNVSLTPLERQMVAILIAAGPAGLDPDPLAEAVWGEELPKSWKEALRNSIARINGKMDEGLALVSKGQGVRRLLVDPQNVDAWRLEDEASGPPGEELDIELLLREPFEGLELTSRLRAYTERLQTKRQDLVDSRLKRGALSPELAQLLESQGLDIGPILSRRITQLGAVPSLRDETELSALVARMIEERPAGLRFYGDPGVGKTTLAANLASRLADAGYHTAYVAAGTGNHDENEPSAKYEPFSIGIPGLREVLNGVAGAEEATVRGHIIEHLETTYGGGRPLCLVVDNIHRLDDASRNLVSVLAAAGLELELLIFAVGRADQTDAPWRDWLADLRVLDPIEVDRLLVDHVDQLLARKLPQCPGHQRYPLAVEIHQMSSGIPAVAALLAETIDTTTFQLAAADSKTTGFDAVVDRLPQNAVDVAGRAALLGMQFSLDQLRVLADVDPVSAKPLLDQLVEDGHLERADGPDEYRFPHALLADAFAHRPSTPQKLDVHLRALQEASELSVRAYHARQARLLGQGPSATEVAEMKIKLAREQAEKSEFWRAAENFRQARDLDENAASLEDRIAELDAKERAGQPSRDQRWDLVAEASLAQRPDLALSAAASGLPEVEDLWGDANRVAAFRSVDEQNLEHADWVRWAVLLSRQLFLIGDIEAAYEIGRETLEVARSADEKAQAWIAMNRAKGWTLVTGTPEDLPWLDEVADIELAQFVRQCFVVSQIANGGSRSGFDAITGYTGRTQKAANRSLHWFARCIEATALLDQGRLQEASDLSDEALQYGRRHGIAIAWDTYLTQTFATFFHRRSHAELFKMIDADRSDNGKNLLYQVGLCSSEFAHYLDDDRKMPEVAVKATMLAKEGEHSQFAPEIACLLASALGASGHAETLQWAHERLLPKANSYVLIGSAIANLGPGANTIARLTADPDERRRYHQQAIDQADQNKLALWQVVCRADLAAELDENDPYRQQLIYEARGCAQTDWLEQVLQGRLDWSSRFAQALENQQQ